MQNKGTPREEQDDARRSTGSHTDTHTRISRLSPAREARSRGLPAHLEHRSRPLACMMLMLHESHAYAHHLSLVSSIFFITVLDGTRYMSRWFWLVWM